MDENRLTPDSPRLGWLYLSPASDPGEVAAMLLDKDSSLQLTLPLSEALDREAPYSRWWSDGVMHMDDPSQTKHSYEPPRSLVFQDALGTVSLVGCRSTNYRSSMAAGHGIVVANYAVLGGRSFGYEHINGMRTESPAISAWTRLSAISSRRETDDRHRIQALHMTLSSPPDVPLARNMNLALRVTWRADPKPGTFVATEAVQVETLTKDERSWPEHLRFHGAMLDLVTIAGWKPFGFSRVTVRLDSDVLPDPRGGHEEPRWLQVATHRFPEQIEPFDKTKFLFPYDEVGPRGVKRWLKLRKEYERAIDPLLSIVRSDEPWSIASVVQSGIALESLGYLIDVNDNDGAHLNRFEGIAFNKGLQVILDDMEIKPFDTEGWIERANASYMGAKHADRGEMPDMVDMLNSLRENLYILRFWIALRLGVKPATLLDRLRTDPNRSAFRALD